MRYRDLVESTLKLLPGETKRMRGSYGAFVITMHPEDFLKLTCHPNGDYDRIAAKPFPQTEEEYETFWGHKEEYGRFSMPFLTVEWPSGQIRGHEGRHRAMMIMKQDGKSFPVTIFLRHPHEYEVTYDAWNVETDETEKKSEDFGTDYAAAHARMEELEMLNQQRRKAWDDGSISDHDVVYQRIKMETHRFDVIKGSPSHEGADPWDRKPYRIDDMPKQLIGQYDPSVSVSDYRVGLLKGYKHFR